MCTRTYAGGPSGELEEEEEEEESAEEEVGVLPFRFHLCREGLLEGAWPAANKKTRRKSARAEQESCASG